MRADLYAERKERAREVNERKAQKKASDATTKQLQLRSNIANACHKYGISTLRGAWGEVR